MTSLKNRSSVPDVALAQGCMCRILLHKLWRAGSGDVADTTFSQRLNARQRFLITLKK